MFIEWGTALLFNGLRKAGDADWRGFDWGQKTNPCQSAPPWVYLPWVYRRVEGFDPLNPCSPGPKTQTATSLLKPPLCI